MKRIGLVLALVFVGATPLFAQGDDVGRLPVEELKKKLPALDLKKVSAAYRDALTAALENAAELEDEAADAKDEAAQKALAEKAGIVAERVDALAVRAQLVVDAMKAKDMDTGELELLLVDARGFDPANLSADLALSFADKWVTKGKDWLSENAVKMALDAVMFLLILLAFKVLGKILGGVASRTMAASRLKVSDLLRAFFVNVITKMSFLVGLLIGLDFIGISIGPLLAGIGVMGFVIGFALQGTLSNFASGIMILLYRPYDIGDVIDAAGVKGKVHSMSLVSTTLFTPDNQVVVVPNNSIWGGVITNVTANDTRRVDMVMGIGYDDDIDKAQEVIERIVNAHELVLKDPAPVVAVNNLGESSVDFIVRPWTKTSDYGRVRLDLTKALKQEFDKQGISIPYPQRDLHVYQQAS